MRISNSLLPPDDLVIKAADEGASRLAQPAVRTVAVALGSLLLGYMFLGRGFDHLGVPPIYVGEVVLAISVVATGYALWRHGVRAAPTRTIWLLLGLMALGAVRTIPFLGVYGLDTLRDATLWGYAVFALVVVVIADRDLVLRAFRAYGWVVPVFAVWLPISYSIFASLSAGIDPRSPGSFVPLVFFKGGDMAVHIVGVVAFLILGNGALLTRSSILLRVVIGVPLVLTAFIAGAANRGALLTIVAGIVIVVLLAPRSRNWLPLLLSAVLLAAGLTVQGALGRGGVAVSPAPTSSPASTSAATPLASPTTDPNVTPSGTGSMGSGQTVPPPARSSGPPPASAAPSIPLPGAIPVANSGFELGSVGGSIPGWTPFGVGTYWIVGGEAHAGAQFAAVNNTRNPFESRLTSSQFPFVAGEDIQVSVWVRAVQGVPAVEVYVDWYDQTGQRISSEFLKRLATNGITAWQEVVGVATAPTNAVRADVLLWEAAGHAAIGFDDVSVRAGEFVPRPPSAKGRPATLGQVIDNILSVFGSSSDAGLEGSKQFRLEWWGTIVNYTVFGNYFWTGKGFGVNLADADGFQATADHSLRAPHSSHFTVLARMGVPGFVLWVLLQAAFGLGLLWALRALRRAGDARLAAAAGWLLAYWIAMMVDTSFDPYLEGPQGGIWFWVVFGMGLVVIRLASRRRTA
ncbi:MAG: O-antigen ligase family protein [Chloroflexi bacterium]|nr:O-antigen ligase family protein [Chloroflexota bacterium]